MSEINYQALREIAKQATPGEWVAFISSGTGTYAVHTPGDKRCEDVIKWTGFDGQKNAENNARYIAAFNPEVVQALLDELEAAEKRIAELEANKCKPVMFIDGDISPADADKLAAVIREFNEETETPAARMARIIRENPHPTNMCDMPAAGIGKGE